MFDFIFYHYVVFSCTCLGRSSISSIKEQLLPSINMYTRLHTAHEIVQRPTEAKAAEAGD